MAWRRKALMAGAILATTACAASAHHSIGMFDQLHPIELVGTVQDFEFTNPHSVIILDVQAGDAESVTWRLEGLSANSLAWAGWSHKTLKPGDRLRVTVEPLRSGRPGGAWTPAKVKFKDGSPITLAR